MKKFKCPLTERRNPLLSINKSKCKGCPYKKECENEDLEKIT